MELLNSINMFGLSKGCTIILDAFNIAILVVYSIVSLVAYETVLTVDSFCKSTFFFKEAKYLSNAQPAVSVSNAGQLALDLLIQSTKAIKVCNIWHEALIPLIGAHPFKDGSSEMCSEFEVYQLKEQKVLFIQFRSPMWQNKEEDFLNLLIGWFLKLEVQQVVILSSLYDYERKDCQIKDSHIRCCLCPKTQSLYSSNFKQLNCNLMETVENVESSGVMTKDTFLPGAGFTQNLHLKCIENNLPCVSFFKFCSDGDNTPEALDLAKLVDGWLNIVPENQDKTKTFAQPPSWRYLFGGPSPQELFP